MTAPEVCAGRRQEMKLQTQTRARSQSGLYALLGILSFVVNIIGGSPKILTTSRSKELTQFVS